MRVQVRLTGPSSTVVRQFAIDTGSTYTVVAPDVLTSIGYGSNDVERWVPMATVTRLERAGLVLVTSLRALGIERQNHPVLLHEIPPAVRLDGLLGLDFLRGSRICIDFRSGVLEVE